MALRWQTWEAVLANPVVAASELTDELTMAGYVDIKDGCASAAIQLAELLRRREGVTGVRLHPGPTRF